MLTKIEAIAKMEGFYAIVIPPNRPQRNHNPGDIEYGAFAKAHGAISGDPRFAVFPDDATGFAALTALLETPSYINLTVEQMVRKYAPPSENDVAKYIKSFCIWTGAKSSDFIKDTP